VSARGRRLAGAAAVALLVACGEGAYLTAPPGSTLDVVANPSFVAAHGGTAELMAFVLEPTGTAPPDGTVVRWFTDLGRIDPETRTRRGVALARFVSDARSGTATIRAISGGIEATPVEITVGNVRVRAIHLRPEPSRIIESNSTHVIATVVDEFGNPVPNVPVTFHVRDDPATEFLDSAGRPIHTDNNGEAEDVLRTRRNTVGVAEVQASVPTASGILFSDAVRIPIL
jgi:hypothetical protein